MSSSGLEQRTLNALKESGLYYRLGNPNNPLNLAPVKTCFAQISTEDFSGDKEN